MADTHEKLVIAVSSRALFDLEIENEIFEKEGLQKYETQYILCFLRYLS